MERLMRIHEVAQIIGWGKTRTHRAIASGEIPAILVSQGPRRRCWRVRPSQLEKWIEAREIGQGA
jgi:excisionase family DNA binding protein